MAHGILFILYSVFVSGWSFAAPLPGYLQHIDTRALALYRPALPEQGASLEIWHNLESELVVAEASRDTFLSYRVGFHGGFLRSTRLSPDAYRFALCHELGHLFGGAPRRHSPPEWDGPVHEDGKLLLSSEGQADYYASRVCFRALVAGEDHEQALDGRTVPPTVLAACGKAWGAGKQEALACARAALGGYEMLRLVHEFPIDFAQPDPEVVEETILIYPSRQCRLDTALAGALCRDGSPLILDNERALRYGCRRGQGARPACWFRPEEDPRMMLLM